MSDWCAWDRNPEFCVVHHSVWDVYADRCELSDSPLRADRVAGALRSLWLDVKAGIRSRPAAIKGRARHASERTSAVSELQRPEGQPDRSLPDAAKPAIERDWSGL